MTDLSTEYLRRIAGIAARKVTLAVGQVIPIRTGGLVTYGVLATDAPGQEIYLRVGAIEDWPLVSEVAQALHNRPGPYRTRPATPLPNDAAAVVTFAQSEHVSVEHDPATCRQHQDGGAGCMFCDGGLFGCRRCGSFEGATTTHCPGVPMTEQQRDQVYAGKLDFRAGAWVAEGSPHTPNRGWELPSC